MAIDWKTIISEFDGKPTLLQAIGKLRKAVEDETITIQQAQAEIAKLESQQKADESLITTAQSTADEAKINAYNASQKGDQALGKATTADAKAQNAQSAAQDADAKAQQALDLASIEVTLTPETATSGTLTDGQLSTLLLNDNCYIKLNGLIYTLFKRSDTVLQYTAGYLNDTKNVQNIKVLVNSKAWTIENIALPQAKTYMHNIYFAGQFGTLVSDGYIKTSIYSSLSTPFTFDDLYTYISGTSIPAFGVVLDSDYQTNIGLPIELSAINSKLSLSWFKFSENNILYQNVTSENCYIEDTVKEV